MKAFSFEGNGFEYFKIWIVNILLVAITLGIYYPWAKVRAKRYFFANTSLEERNFEYHATGTQLFLGYVIAMVLFIIYVTVQSFSPIGSIVVALIFFAGFPWIVWRSFKFNARMTSFSNVRFSFNGALGGAYFNYMLLPIILVLIAYVIPVAVIAGVVIFLKSQPILIAVISVVSVIITFGLFIVAFSYLKKRVTTYAIGGHRYGQGEFKVDVDTTPFVFIALKTAGLGFLMLFVYMLLTGIVVISTLGVGAMLELQSNMGNPNAGAEFSETILLIIGPIYIGMILGSFLLMAYSYTRQRAYVFSKMSLDGKIHFSSSLKARSLAGVMITNFLLVLVTLGLAAPWAHVRMAKLIADNSLIDADDSIEGYITQQQEEQSPLGEQIGDAFDVNIDVGI
ncbi:MAG: uncharacterized membrane protein YjgN (DUF898 family) [Flavobacteriales bacterium]|jgi:uncharacterized membrane protein YjgN (DUF898 family)